MSQLLETYKAHLSIAGLVFLSFAVTGFSFDIAQASGLTKVVYGFVQVFSLTFSLIAAREMIGRITKKELNFIALTVLVILIGTFLSFVLDYPIIKLFQIIDSNCIFKLNNNSLVQSFLEDLKYPIVFWPICELAGLYLKKLTNIEKKSTIETKFTIEELTFLKDVPKFERKSLLAIEAQQNYIRLIFEQKNYTVLYRLKDAVEQLPQDIGMKVHRSYWVSFAAIEKLKNAQTLLLKNGMEIPVSKTYSKELKERF